MGGSVTPTSCSILIGCFGLLAGAQTQAEVNVPLEKQNIAVARQLPATEVVDLIGNKDYLFDVTQKSVDVALTIDDPSGNSFGPYNSPLTDYGWEQILFTPTSTGPHTLTLFVVDESNVSGRIDVQIRDLTLTAAERAAYDGITAAARSDLSSDSARIAALASYRTAQEALDPHTHQRSRAFLQHAVSRVFELRELPGEAVRNYALAALEYTDIGEEELALWMRYRQASMETYRNRHAASRLLLDEILQRAESIDNARLVSAAENYIGVNYYYEGNFDEAELWILRSLDTLRKTDFVHEQATTLYNLGWIRLQAGDADRSLGYFERALAIETELGDVDEQIDTHLSIATVHHNTGDCGRSVAELNKAWTMARERQNRRQLTRIMSRAGSCYSALGNHRAATSLFARAAELAAGTEDHRERAEALSQLGDNHQVVGSFEDALAAHRAALAIQKTIDDREGAARSLIRITQALMDLGRLDAAKDSLAESRRALQPVSTKLGTAELHLVSGVLFHHLQEIEKAEKALAEARAHFEELQNTEGQYRALLELGRLFFSQDSDVAAHYLDTAISIAESARNRVARPELRARFLATQAEVYFLRAMLEADRFLSRGLEDSLARSFAAINQGRARTLIEEREGLSAALVDGDLDKRSLSAQKRLTAKLLALQDLKNDPDGSARLIAKLEADVELLQLELDALDQEAVTTRGTSRPQSFDRESVQALQMQLSADAAILQYAFHGDEGLAWLVTRDEIAVERIRNVELIESDVQEFYARIAQRRPYRDVGERLSARLLSLLEAAPEVTRLLVVPDGSLHYVPFAALQHPSTGSMLVDTIETSYLPGPFLLEYDSSNTPIKRIAVLADAVFSADDERVGSATEHEQPVPTDFGDMTTMLLERSEPRQRLPFTALEASSIAELGDATDIETGFRVSASTLQRQLAARPDALHVATHGVANMEHPQLSGLVFSTVSPGGEPTEGFFSLSDIYRLNGVPGLVVLSACDTAIGEHIGSEGLMSITRAFVQRGARDVVGTLWKVADRSTAVVMQAFYEELLAERQRPATALRSAQLQIRESRRWRHPYYWAGFTATTVVSN